MRRRERHERLKVRVRRNLDLLGCGSGGRRGSALLTFGGAALRGRVAGGDWARLERDGVERRVWGRGRDRLERVLREDNPAVFGNVVLHTGSKAVLEEDDGADGQEAV